MTAPPRITASLWSVPTERLDAEADRLAGCGIRAWHWDRADGSLGPAGGFTATAARRLAERTGLASEAHLMLADPLAELDDWLAFCERVVVHVEVDRLADALARIRTAGRDAALALSPDVALDTASAHPDAAVLVMSVAPGHGGSAFDPAAVARIATLAVAREVGVDGGVDEERADACLAAGARWLVSGTALLAADDPAAWIAARG